MSCGILEALKHFGGGRDQRKIDRGVAATKVKLWPQGINLWETGLCHCPE